MVSQNSPVLADCQSKLENPLKGGLPWFLRNPQYSVEPSKGIKSCYFLNLDSWQNCSERFFGKAETDDGSFQNLKQKKDISAPMGAQDAKDGTNEVNHGSGAKRILGFPISNMLQSFKDLNSADTLLKVNCSGIEYDSARKVKKDEGVPRNQLGNRDIVLQKGLDNYISDLRQHIHLNLSSDKEDGPSAPSLPTAIVKIATTEIDWEAPIVIKFEADASPKENSRKMVVRPPGKSEVSYEECDRIAAEVMIAISLFGKNNLVDDGACERPKAASINCLKWFSEIISSHCDDTKSIHMDVSLDQNGAYDEEESIPDGMDCFEFMTLKLEDTK